MNSNLNRMRLIFHAVLLVVAVFLFVLPVSFAQDETATNEPVATAEATPMPVEIINAPENITTAPTWLLLVIGGQMAVIIVQGVMLARSVAPGQFTELFKVLRELARRTDSPLDDEAVDIGERVVNAVAAGRTQPLNRGAPADGIDR